jgi:hypothetical protein
MVDFKTSNSWRFLEIFVRDLNYKNSKKEKEKEKFSFLKKSLIKQCHIHHHHMDAVLVMGQAPAKTG